MAIAYFKLFQIVLVPNAWAACFELLYCSAYAFYLPGQFYHILFASATRIIFPWPVRASASSLGRRQQQHGMRLPVRCIPRRRVQLCCSPTRLGVAHHLLMISTAAGQDTISIMMTIVITTHHPRGSSPCYTICMAYFERHQSLLMFHVFRLAVWTKMTHSCHLPPISSAVAT